MSVIAALGAQSDLSRHPDRPSMVTREESVRMCFAHQWDKGLVQPPREARL